MTVKAPFSPQIEGFIDDYVKQLTAGTAALFAGAGLSRSAGYVDWIELLDRSARELGLGTAKGHDLVALAQYYANSVSRDRLNKTIVQRFAKKATLTESHKILARLPIMDWWTTNYDCMLETALENANRVVDVKEKPRDMARAWPRRDAIVYKMHGDVRSPTDAILQTSQYESYAATHQAFVTALQGDLTTKTFLFVGFSFRDPNLTHILAQLPYKGERQHYFFVKKVSAKDFKGTKAERAEAEGYAKALQDLRNADLRRYGITALEIDGFEQIPLILGEIERRYRRRTVFISGSAEEFAPWGREKAQTFLTNLSSTLIRERFRVVTGFGIGVGTPVINGALKEIYGSPAVCSSDQLVMRPFPQTDPADPATALLWREYRQKTLGECGVAIFVFGNKAGPRKGKTVDATGMLEEFEIALEARVIPVPIRATGSMAAQFASALKRKPELSSDAPPAHAAILKTLWSAAEPDDIITAIVAFMNDIND